MKSNVQELPIAFAWPERPAITLLRYTAYTGYVSPYALVR
jgi:hypothetical protein